MDLIRDLGALALGSRLKRLSDQLMQDGIRVYRETGLAFEPRWFPVFYYLSKSGPSAVMDIARGLGITHPAVNQVAKELIAADLVAAYRDARDKRKRVLALTREGKSRLPQLERVWQDIQAALQELLDETQVDFLGYMESLERGLLDRSFYARFLQRYRPGMQGIVISGWDPALAGTFAALNEAWIVEHFELEASDRAILSDPKTQVIDPGGDILFACDEETGEVLGTCALINRGDQVGELAKMTVVDSARGRGIGRLVGDAVIARARELAMCKLYLETNSRLAPALGLYRQLGFVRKPSPFASSYTRADVYMEMVLDNLVA